MTREPVPRFETADRVPGLGFGRFSEAPTRRLRGDLGRRRGLRYFIIAFALPKITEDFGLTTFQSSVVVASTFVGVLAGACSFWGTISDRTFGRKRGCTITIGIFAGRSASCRPSRRNMAWL